MPHRRRGGPPRNDQRSDQSRNPSSQGNPPAPENQPVKPPANPPGQEKPSGQANRPQHRRTGGHRSPFPREISPSELNERINQRKPARQDNPAEKDNTTPQANKPPERRSGDRRSGQRGQSPAQGNATQRRNPAGRNPSNRAPVSRNTPGSSTVTGEPPNASRRGFYVQRSSHTERPAPSVPIRTNKGIKARDQRGQSGQHWWARRWIEAMESLVDQARLLRGRSYAHSGQVLSITETQNGIEARVQGSRPKPYEVTIQVTPLNDRQWDLVIDALSEQALFTAQLLAGEMPGNIEDAFHTAGVSLFPNQTGDLFSECTCPDWANPCKHVAATHYILGDRFDDDPFLLFRMRGRTQEEILEALRERRANTATDEPVSAEAEVETETVVLLEDVIDHFWEPLESLDSFPLTIKLASVDMPLLNRLGEPAFMGGESLQALLKPFYDTFTRSALRAAYSEEEPVEPSNGHENNGNTEPE